MRNNIYIYKNFLCVRWDEKKFAKKHNSTKKQEKFLNPDKQPKTFVACT